MKAKIRLAIMLPKNGIDYYKIKVMRFNRVQLMIEWMAENLKEIVSIEQITPISYSVFLRYYIRKLT